MRNFPCDPWEDAIINRNFMRGSKSVLGFQWMGLQLLKLVMSSPCHHYPYRCRRRRHRRRRLHHHHHRYRHHRAAVVITMTIIIIIQGHSLISWRFSGH